MADDLIGYPEASRILGLAVDSIRHLASSGHLKPIRRDKRVMFDRDAVERLAKRRAERGRFYLDENPERATHRTKPTTTLTPLPVRPMVQIFCPPHIDPDAWLAWKGVRRRAA